MDDQKMQSKQMPIQKSRPTFLQVKQLSPASVGFNLHAKVGKIKPIMRRLNLDGTKLRIYEAVIGDETGCILLSLRNDQIDKVKESDVIILRNAKIDMVNNGFMRVAIDRWGLIQVVDTEQGVQQINTNNNLSLVEYELVKEEDTRNNNNNNNNNRGGGGGGGGNQRQRNSPGRGGGGGGGGNNMRDNRGNRDRGNNNMNQGRRGGGGGGGQQRDGGGNNNMNQGRRRGSPDNRNRQQQQQRGDGRNQDRGNNMNNQGQGRRGSPNRGNMNQGQGRRSQQNFYN